ncbi:hypothetical protein [Photobacterium leiognathi]|uniref:hypothetical protein n=1 Tax=Photobacterium leiognathi TaxID=553611 RepID=UPI002982387F|nr:hypothetical protein [Photobacterium leiognathi]
MKSIKPTTYEALILLEVLQSYSEDAECKATEIALNLRNEIMNNLPRITHPNFEFNLELNLERIDVIDNALVEYEENNVVDQSIFNSCVPEVEHRFLGVLNNAEYESLLSSTVSDIYFCLSERVNAHREHFLFN